jgi:hypothetical protein
VSLKSINAFLSDLQREVLSQDGLSVRPYNKEKQMKNLLRSILCLVVIFWLVPWLQATTVVKLTNQDLAEEAELIAIGHCAETRSSWIGRNLVTLATISVSEVLKGAGRSTVTVVLPGGVDANRKFPVATTWPGAPQILPQEEVFLFLANDNQSAGGHTILGFSQGKFSIVKDARGKKMVSRDLSQMSLQGEAGVSRGSKTLVPLEQFKQEISELLAGSGVRSKP